MLAFPAYRIPCSSRLQMRGNMAAETTCMLYSLTVQVQRKAGPSQFKFPNVQGRTVIGHAWAN